MTSNARAIDSGFSTVWSLWKSYCRVSLNVLVEFIELIGTELEAQVAVCTPEKSEVPIPGTTECPAPAWLLTGGSGTLVMQAPSDLR